jgi:hypothetical protein
LNDLAENEGCFLFPSLQSAKECVEYSASPRRDNGVNKKPVGSDQIQTLRKDKLVAVSGVARLFAAKFGTTYLAGMWKEDLAIQLAWQADEPSGIDIGGCMPSGPWAALDSSTSTQNLQPDLN